MALTDVGVVQVLHDANLSEQLRQKHSRMLNTPRPGSGSVKHA